MFPISGDGFAGREKKFFPSPFQKKRGILPLRLSRHSSQSDGGLSRLTYINLSHPYSHKRALHVCHKANTSHCKAILHDGGNPSLHIHHPTPFQKKRGIAAPLSRQKLAERRRIVKILIVTFSFCPSYEFLFFLPCFFEKFNEFRPDFRISHFIPGRIYIDKPSHVTSRYTKNIFFRNTA